MISHNDRPRPACRQSWSLCLMILVVGAQTALGAPPQAEQEAPPTSPLLALRISEPVMSLLIGKEVDRTSKVDRTLFDARVLGVARTTGRLSLELRPGGEHAAFCLVLRGTTVSKTIGYVGPARIYSVRSTPFEARALIDLKDRRFTYQPAEITIHPSQVEERIASTISGIRGQIVRKVANRQLDRLREDLDTIADDDAASHVCASLNAAVERRLARMNRRLRARHYLQALQFNRTEQWKLHVNTTDDYLQISLFNLPRGATPQANWPAAPATAPVELWLHSSLLDQRATELFEHWPGLGAALAEAFPSLDRPFFRGSGWVTERLVRLKLAKVDDWVVFRAGPVLWQTQPPAVEPAVAPVAQVP